MFMFEQFSISPLPSFLPSFLPPSLPPFLLSFLPQIVITYPQGANPALDTEVFLRGDSKQILRSLRGHGKNVTFGSDELWGCQKV